MSRPWLLYSTSTVFRYVTLRSEASSTANLCPSASVGHSSEISQTRGATELQPC
jgi:hypothetical protein